MTTKTTYFAAFCLIVFSTTCVFAQNRTTKDKEDDISQMASAFTVIKPVAAEAQNQGEVIRLLQGDNLTDEAKTSINNYLQRYFLARWTDPNNSTEFAKYKKELSDLLGQNFSPQGKEFLLSRLVTLLYGFATKTDFYPACRYNAVLTLGELDSGQAADGRATPYLPALARLLRIYSNQGDGTDAAGEAIRLGALLGIRRHAILGISAANQRDEQAAKQQVVKLLVSIAADSPYKEDTETEGTSLTGSARNVAQSIVVKAEANAENITEKYRTVDQHNWFRNRAIDTLGYLNNTSPELQSQIIDALLALIENGAELPSIQYVAAYSLSNYNATIAKSPDLLKRTTEAMLQLGLAVCEDGKQTMIAERSTMQTTGSLSMGGSSSDMAGGFSSAGGGIDANQLQADQINNSLIQIKDGFSSILACIAGANFRSGGLISDESLKNSPYHEVWVGLNQAITNCVKFLDEGDPEVVKRRAQQTSTSDGMSTSGTSSSDGLAAAATVKNPPKVTMPEIENRLKTLRADIEILQNVMSSLQTGTAASR